jgi:phosphomannomutase
MRMKFGTSGLRGLVSDMTDPVCEAYVKAFLDHLMASGRAPHRLLVGRDLRPSSPRIAGACLRAAAERGVEAVDCGALPTPALALEAMAHGVPAVMVTGSHIPFDRNGLKFYAPSGEISKDDEAGIVAALNGSAAARPAAPVVTSDAAMGRYRERGLAIAPPGGLQGLRIGVHQHSAVGRDLTAGMLADMGADVVVLGRSEEFVPVDTEAVSDADVARARGWAAEHGLDVLVTTDGDGDRPLVADETGEFFRGDALGMLTARWLGADAVATPVSSTTAIERSGWFSTVRRTRIGSPYVIAAMEALAAEGARLPVAFEANGGFLLGAEVRRGDAVLAALPTRDAILPILAVIGLAREDGGPLSALRAVLPERHTASDRLQEVPTERSAPLLTGLAQDAAARDAFLAEIGLSPSTALDLTDGVRISAGDAIAHLRPSGNAPELRAYAEADEAAEAARIVSAALAWVGSRI